MRFARKGGYSKNPGKISTVERAAFQVPASRHLAVRKRRT